LCFLIVEPIPWTLNFLHTLPETSNKKWQNFLRDQYSVPNALVKLQYVEEDVPGCSSIIYFRPCKLQKSGGRCHWTFTAKLSVLLIFFSFRENGEYQRKSLLAYQAYSLTKIFADKMTNIIPI
jgi:hypothetical protein